MKDRTHISADFKTLSYLTCVAFLFADFVVIEQFIVFLDFLVPVLPLFLPQEEQLRKPVDVRCSKRVIMIIQLLISPKKGCNAFNSSKTWISWTDSRTGLSISTNFPRFVDILSLDPICGYINPLSRAPDYCLSRAERKYRSRAFFTFLNGSEFSLSGIFISDE